MAKSKMGSGKRGPQRNLIVDIEVSLDVHIARVLTIEKELRFRVRSLLVWGCQNR